MQTPFKPIEFLSRDISVEKRMDGTILLQSNHALKPYERHVPAFLAGEEPKRYVCVSSPMMPIGATRSNVA